MLTNNLLNHFTLFGKMKFSGCYNVFLYHASPFWSASEKFLFWSMMYDPCLALLNIINIADFRPNHEVKILQATIKG